MFLETHEIRADSIARHSLCFYKRFTVRNTSWQRRHGNGKTTFWFGMKYKVIVEIFHILFIAKCTHVVQYLAHFFETRST